MFLETERLVIRKLQESDFADFCKLVIDEERCRMMGSGDISDEESARLTFDWLMNKEECGCALVYKETGRLVGNLTVCRVPQHLTEMPELKGKTGRSLSFSVSKAYRRQGLMYEAVSAVIEYLFNADIDYINDGYFDFNIPSLELHKKLGFTHLLTDHFEQDGVEMVGIENILWRKQS